jgi:single-strand DNA-binding protein
MINKAVLMGRLTRDPELRHTQNNTPVTSFTLAVDRGKRSNAPNAQTVDFIDIVAWQTTAEFVAKWFRKGLLVAVVGRIQSRKWTDKDGKSRTAIEVVADEVHFAESKKDASPATPATSDGYTDITNDDEKLPF